MPPLKETRATVRLVQMIASDVFMSQCPSAMDKTLHFAAPFISFLLYSHTIARSLARESNAGADVRCFLLS